MSRPLPPSSEFDPAPDPEVAAELAAYAAAPNFCRYCGHVGLVPAWRSRFFAKPMGTWSLAGVQNKTVAHLVAWPWLTCPGCGHASEGKL